MTIKASELTEGRTIFVRGKTSFSRLASLVEGEALAKSIQQAVQRGAKYPTKVPHTTINLVDAQVIAANPAAPTVEEQYLHEKLYTVKSGENAGKLGYGIDNKSPYLPTVLEQDPDNIGQYRQLVLERDLASGMDVTLILQTFKSGDNENRGIGIEQVVLNEPVRYYSSGVDTSALAARGIVVNGPIRSVNAADAPTEANQAAAAFASDAARAGFDATVPPNSTVNASGLAMPTPGATGVVPVQQPVAPQIPAQPAQPVQQYAPAQPVQPAGPVVPVQQVAPVQQAPAQVAPVAAPVGEMSLEDQMAALQQRMAEQKAADANSGANSAFAAPAAEASPWAVTGQNGAAFQG